LGKNVTFSRDEFDCQIVVKKLQHLEYGDNKTLLSESWAHMQESVSHIFEEAKNVCANINGNSTKIMQLGDYLIIDNKLNDCIHFER
jgi:hypothetical protein